MNVDQYRNLRDAAPDASEEQRIKAAHELGMTTQRGTPVKDTTVVKLGEGNVRTTK